jgi:hypothetical protein
MAEDLDNGLRPMGTGHSVTITTLTWLVPALALGALGFLVGGLFDRAPGIGLALPILWTATFIGAGFFTVEQQCWIVVQRLGQFHSVKLQGVRWMNFVFDRVKQRGNVLAHRHTLYSEGASDAEIDFKDATAAIKASYWFSVGNPKDIAERNQANLKRDIALYVYRYADPIGRISGAIDGALRPLLQNLTIDQAQTGGEAACLQASAEAAPAMKLVGTYPPAEKPIIIDDIVVPQDIQEIRESELKGEKEGKAAAARMAAPIAVVTAMKNAAGNGLTFQDVERIVARSQVLDTLGKTGSNITLIGRDVDGLVGTFEVGRAGAAK